MYAAGLLSMGGVLAWYLHTRNAVFVVPTHADQYTRLLDYPRLLYFMQFQLLSRIPELVMTYGGLVFFTVGSHMILWKKRDVFWLAWFFGVAAHLCAMSGYAHYHEYTALPLAPVAAGLMGVGVVRLRAMTAAAPRKRRSLALAGLALLIIAIPAHTALRIGHWYKQGYDFLANAGKAAATVSAPDDLFFTNCQSGPALLYYLDRRGWNFELDLDPSIGDAAIDAAQAKGARFIASEKRGLFSEPDGLMWKRFHAHGAPVWDDGKLVIFPFARTKGSSGVR